MLADLLLLMAGLAVLMAGGEMLVRGAASLARDLGISPLVIGLTVVAFGTSAPELAVNVGAALRDTGALSFGNIFGSNMANIGLIVGLVALLNPIPIDNVLMRRELPMLLLATAAAAVLALDAELGGTRDAFQRGDGLILLLFFAVFVYYTLGDLLRHRSNGRSACGEGGTAATPLPADEGGPTRTRRDLALCALGLIGLIGGAHLTVVAAVDLARAFAVPEVVVGLTIISVGTSLPELTAALIAVRRGESSMAVGSIVGSNIFNTLLIAGTTATIRPMPIPPGGQLDLAATALLSLVLMLTAGTHRQLIIRYEGLLLLGIYLGYLVWRTLGFSVLGQW